MKKVTILSGKHTGCTGVVSRVEINNQYPYYYILLDGDNRDTVFFGDEFKVNNQ